MSDHVVQDDYSYEWDNAAQQRTALPWVVRQYGVSHPVARFATIMLAREYCEWRNAANGPRYVYDCRWCDRSFPTLRGCRTHEAAVHHGLGKPGQGVPGNEAQRASYHAHRTDSIVPRLVGEPRPAPLRYDEQGG